MEMVFLVVGLGFSLLAMGCNLFILVHAFMQDTTKGLLCLCVPCYILYYMFAEFDHPQKAVIIAGSLGGGLLGRGFATLGGAGQH